MKSSKYTRIYQIDDKRSVIYNYANEKYVFFVNDLLPLLNDNISSPNKIKEIHPDFYNAIVNSGMFVSEDIDETTSVKNKIISDLSSRDVLRITINPTLDCNLRCWYCYEVHKKNTFMNESVLNAIIEYLKRNVFLYKRVSVGLFGGEPMLRATKIAIPFLRKAKAICDNYMVPFTSHITTNGTLLQKKIVDEIVSTNIPVSLQIAFDGNREKQNKVKNWNGRGTYDMVLANLAYAASKGIAINVRCNFTSKNILSFQDLVKDLENCLGRHKDVVTISFQRVWQEKSTELLYAQAKSISNYAYSHGFATSVAEGVCFKSYCYADYENSFLFNHDGQVYKCTARDFNINNSIGKINADGTIDFKDNYPGIRIRFNNSCEDCSLLPICTICIQAHIENSGSGCPVSISETDKESQIKNHFFELFKHL